MEFDKSRVYTAVNADELKIGSLIIVALNLEALERNVESETDIQKLEKIAGIDCGERFGVDIYHDKNNLRYYPLAYLIEPPKEPQYKPFSNIENLKKAVVKCKGFIKTKEGVREGIIIGLSFNNEVLIKTRWGISYSTFEQLFKNYIFDDGSPCGELAEEGERNDEKGKD